MRKDIHCIAFFTKHNNNESKEVSLILKEKLIEKGIKVIDYLLNSDFFNNNNSNKEIDLAIAVGGDGTTLRAFRILAPGIPVLSINAGGTRGILSEVSKDSAISIIPYLLKGDYFLDNRIRLLAKINDKHFYHALNDFVFIRSDLTKTPTFHLSICDNNLIQKMDGMVISTPTGSTGHSLSHGGPILHENLECILVTPIASVNRMSSFIIPLMKLNLYANYDITLIIDGQQIYNISKNEKISISSYEHDAIFLRFNKNKLRQMTKLGY
ncbi:MAG: NAD(+)/NADH kinase [Candidatus Nitrosocosmicus sp.]